MWFAAFTSLLLFSPPLAAAAETPDWLAGELSLSTGVDYSDGDYSNERTTETLFVPVTLSYLFDQFAPSAYPNDLFELRITVPWLSIDGPGNPDIPAAQIIGFQRAHGRSGLGDIVVGAAYLVFPPPRSPLPAVELSTRVKIPTASDADLLGTGSPAWTLQADLYRRVGRLTPLLTAGYRISDGKRFDLRNAFFTSVGASFFVYRALTAGLLYDWSQKTSAFSSDTHELFPYLVLRLSEQLRLMPYTVIGLSNQAPDWGAGFQLRFSIAVR